MKVFNRLVEQPPLLYRLLFPEALWRIKRKGKAPVVFLTFDDGPIPEERRGCSICLTATG